MPAFASPRRGRRSSASTFLPLGLFGLIAMAAAPSSASPTGQLLESRAQTPFSAPDAAAWQDILGLQRVNVTLAVMSRCPDALACEAAFDKVLDRVNAKTRVTMTYIGSPEDDKEHYRYGVSCMHGEQECAGNVQQLCVQDALNPARAGEDFDLSPSAAQKKWWNFLQCQNYAGLSKIGEENLAQRCLRVVDGPSWDKDGIAKCVQGKHGRKLLQHSVKASRKANMGTSCTIEFESGKRCIRDGGAWRNCDLGHETADFVAEIERIWDQKNGGAKQLVKQSDDSAITPTKTKLVKRQSSTTPSNNAGASNTGFGDPFGGSRTPPSVFHRLALQKRSTDAFLAKRQSSNMQFQGPNLPVPFLGFAVAAIALFVIVVCFVLLRIVMRNRRLRRMGLLPEGPFDRLLGPTREIEDTLTPPKLLEARIAHDFRPATYDADVKAKGWDAVMPISAAVPPVLYSDLFPGGPKSKEADAAISAGADGANTTSFSYPPTSGSNAGLRGRLHVPHFLRRGDGGNHDDAAANDNSTNEARNNGGDANAKSATPDGSTSASVNVTVLIAMPSQRTVFPSTQSSYNNSTLKSKRSLNLDGVASGKIDEVEEYADASESRTLRRTDSIKSFRTAASAKSIGEARREAFFNKMNEGEDEAAANDMIHSTPLDDEDEEELPELVFGTASVPIFTRIPGSEPFAGIAEAYQPLRSELQRLVTGAHEARERRAAMEAAAKQAEKDVGNADDGQTTIDERSTNQAQLAGVAGNAGVTADGHRVSASETIDSETAAIIGSNNMATMPASHQDGLGDVVGRMMMPEPAVAQHGTSASSPVPASAIGGSMHRFGDDPRPSIGVHSNFSRADTVTPVQEGGAAPYNTSTLTLDPLLGDQAGSYAARNAGAQERSS